MTANLLYVIGTVAAWVGVALLLRALANKPARGISAVSGGLLLLVASATPAYQHGLAIPLVWLAMPFAGWAALACFAVSLARVAQHAMDAAPPPTGNEPHRQVPRRLVSATAWFACGLTFIWMFHHDPANKVDIIRGHIALSIAGSLALVAFGIAGVTVLSSAGRFGKTLAIHATLLAGCVVFGLPFAWLLITSFKEDRDLTTASGLVWIPKVQRTVPYLDPKSPLLAGTYKGNQVQASLTGRTSDGSYIVEIERPSSLLGISFTAPATAFKVIPEEAPVVRGAGFTGFVAHELADGRRVVRFLTPPRLYGKERTFLAADLKPVRDVGLRWRNYTDALEAMPPETLHGFVYLKNTLIIAVLSVVGTLASSALVAYGFARLRFPGREVLFKVLLATMMLPGAVTLMPQFLLFRSLGWIDSLYPLWVPAFFGSAFNVFLLRQFFSQVPTELEDAGKIDGAGVLRVLWSIVLPQAKPALAVVAIWTFMGAWNNFLGPLIYVNTPENMPLSYALQLFQGDRGGEPGLMMAFATLTIIPIILLFFFAQRYFIEGVSLSGLGGR